MSVLKLARHWWWAGAAVLLGVFDLWAVAGNLADPQGPYLDGTVVASVAALTTLGGVGIRTRRREIGDAMIIAGVTPSLLVVWFPPVPVLALVVLLCALIELAELRALDRPGHRGAVLTGVAGGAVLLVAGIWLSVSANGGLWAVAAFGIGAVVVLGLLAALAAALIRRRPAPGRAAV